jgi:hypothetical protein
MSQLVSESYECNTPRTILFLKTSGEETLRWPYMFLCLIIPGLDHPGPKLNVMLNPLIDELKELWNGDKTYDSHKKQKFTFQAAYLSSIHDFMAYGIFAGWSVHGRLTCLICRSDTNCFCLTTGGKISYLDCY